LAKARFVAAVSGRYETVAALSLAQSKIRARASALTLPASACYHGSADYFIKVKSDPTEWEK
jgi:hypothetical protein